MIRTSVMGLMVLVSCVGPDGKAPEPDGGADQPPPGQQPPGHPPLPATVPQPSDNPTSPAKVALGRLLFWDPVLSGNADIACASCHDPRTGYADGRRTAVGTVDPTLTPPNRNSPTVLNTAWNGSITGAPIPRAEDAPMFWDNRAHSLEHQARGPLTAPAEMMGTSFSATTIFPELVSRLQGIPAYATQFEAVFGVNGITETNIVRAIAAFERTLTNTQSSFDRFIGGDPTAMTPQQQRGFRVFQDNGCVHCHNGPMFSDYQLHELRVPDLAGVAPDAGDGSNRFRTPSLRNITRTAPYMHHGGLAGIPQVFQFYRQATQDPRDPALRGVRTVAPEDAPDVIAFFEALGDAPFDTSIPPTVPSGLTPGGTH